MSTELEPDLQLEIAHVLFVDIVSYSKLLINEQRDSLRELNKIVRNTYAFRAAEMAGKLIRLRPATEWRSRRRQSRRGKYYGCVVAK